MLVTMGRSWLLFVLLALIAVSSALEVKGVEQFAVLNKRQSASGSAASAEPSETPNDPETTPTPTPTPPPPSSSPRPPSTPSPTPTPTPEPSPTPDEPSETPSSETSRATRTSNTPPPANSTPPTSTPRRTTIETFTSPIVTSSVQQFITVVTITRDGSSTVETQTSSSTIALTSQATFTGVPGVNNNDGNGGDSGGLSSSSKKIIGGVVGGVGGAILLGGIAIVCWRIWGRKKRVTEDDADLMAGTGAALGDKPHSANSPFQSNLEQYHTPGGRPNAAANF